MYLELKHCYRDVYINQQLSAIALEFTRAPIYSKTTSEVTFQTILYGYVIWENILGAYN